MQGSAGAMAKDDGPNVDGAIDAIDFDEVDNYFSSTGLSKNLSTREILKRVVESNYDIDVILDSLDVSAWFIGLKSTFINLLITLIFIMLCSSIVNSITLQDDNTQILESITIIFAILISINAVKDCANAATLIYDEIERFSDVMIPILCTILTVMGGIGSAGLTQAMMLLVNTTMLEIIKVIIMPMIMVVVVMGMIAPLSSRDWLNSMKDTISSIIKWVIGLSVAIVTTVFSLRGISVAATDGIMLKTAEYAISDLVPVVGGSISKITGVIIGGIVMVKNAFGAVAIVVLFLRCMAPILLILMYILLFRVASAMADMFQNKKMSTLCASLSSSLVLYLVVSVSIVVMLLVIVISSVGAANRIMAFA